MDINHIKLTERKKLKEFKNIKTNIINIFNNTRILIIIIRRYNKHNSIYN